MLAYLIGLLSGEVEIEIHPDHFRFRRKERELNVPTHLYLNTNGKKFRLIGVGEDFIAPDLKFQQMRIDLFSARDVYPPDIDKTKALVAFLRYGISKVSNRLFARPRVIIGNVNSLQELLCGFQRPIIKQAVLNAGARGCIFKD